MPKSGSYAKLSTHCLPLPIFGRLMGYLCPKPVEKIMCLFPLNEQLLLESLIGFETVTEEERKRVRIKWFRFENESILKTVTLFFNYINKCNQSFDLQYELVVGREETKYYMHVMYVDDYEEHEFSDFREAIDFCDKWSLAARPNSD